jgi:membrane protein DedA with SNARE-associated domain
MLELFLSMLTTYGPVALGLVLLLGAAGLPLPTAPLLIATGALVREGTLALPTVAGLALAGVVFGDIKS